MRDPSQRLRGVLEAIERIEDRISGGRAAFEDDAMLQVWVLHHLQIISEACRSLPENFRQQRAEVDWSRLVGMRHVLVHQDFEIDTDIVWAVVERELPMLKQKVNEILDRGAD
jgi:uncharacterized protein with HEPN domain